MSQRRNNISNIILFAIIAVCLYIVSRIVAFEISSVEYSYAAFREFYPQEILFVLGVLIALSVWYIIVEKRNGMLKLHIPLIIFLSVLFVISIVSICSFPSELHIDLPLFKFVKGEDGGGSLVPDGFKENCIIYVSNWQKILYIIISFVALYSTYIVLWVLPRKIRYLRQLNMFMYLIIAFAIFAMVFSYINEADKYHAFFDSLTNPEANLDFEHICSILANRNTFGVLMVFACFACFYLHHLNHKWWFLAVSPLFIFQILLIGSKTNAAIGLLSLVIYFTIWMVFRFRKHLISSIIILGVLTLIGGGILVIFLIHNNDEMFLGDFFKAQDKLFNYYVVKVFDNQDSFTGRVALYERSFALFNATGSWAIGVGYGLYNYLVLAMENLVHIPGSTWDSSSITSLNTQLISSESPHSAYIQIMGTGGIITLVFFGLMMAYLIFAMVRVFKKNKVTVLLCATFLLGALFHGVTESATLIFFSPIQIDSLIFTMFAIIPIFSLYYHSKHPTENQKFLANYVKKNTKWSKFDKSCLVAKSIYFFLTPAVMALCVLVPMLWPYTFAERGALFIVTISILAFYIVAPLVLQAITDRKTPFVEFIKQVSLPYFLEIIVFLIFVHLYSYIFGWTFALGTIFFYGLMVGHFSLFAISKFYSDRAGIIVLLMDKLCNQAHKKQVQYIGRNKRKDSLTLEEKFFSLLIPKRFKHHETTNN